MWKETEKLQNSSEFSILAGDWNIALDHEIDTFDYKSEQNRNAKRVVIDGMNNLGLVDIFRETHPDKKDFHGENSGIPKGLDLTFI